MREYRCSGCSTRTSAADDLHGSEHGACGGTLSLASAPPLPRCRLFADGVGDRGLPLRFVLRWNQWLAERRRSG